MNTTLVLALLLKPLVLMAIVVPTRYLANRYLPPGKWRDVLLRPIPGTGPRGQGGQVWLSGKEPPQR